jgi:hypothetical protein
VAPVLQVETPFNDVMLAEPDSAAIKDLHTACCVEGGATSSLCTQVRRVRQECGLKL